MQGFSAVSSDLVCPSFSAYFADDIAQTAVRVSNEVLAADPESPAQSRNDDFEFAVLLPDPNLPFPIFSRNSSVKAEDPKNRVVDDKLDPLRISFGKLLVDDGDLPSSSSSGEEEEVDVLEGVPRGTFCIWNPRRPPQSPPSGCRKSNSTGSSSKNSKRWRLTDFILRRSKSDGKRLWLSSSTPPVFTNSTYPASISATKKLGAEDKKRMKKMLPHPPPSPSAHEFFYGRNGLNKKGEKRRTYLPYRKDLVGIFANAHGLGRNIARS